MNQNDLHILLKCLSIINIGKTKSRKNKNSQKEQKWQVILKADLLL